MKRLRIYSPFYYLAALFFGGLAWLLIDIAYEYQNLEHQCKTAYETVDCVVYWTNLVLLLGLPFLFCLPRIEIVKLDKIHGIGSELHFIIPSLLFLILMVLSLLSLWDLILLSLSTLTYWYGFLRSKWLGLTICPVAAIAIAFMIWMFIYFE